MDTAAVWPRVAASGVDLAVILGWLAALTVVAAVVRPRLPEPAAEPSLVLTDLIAFAFTVAPLWIYLTATEAGARQATVGKRVTGLRVVAAGGGRAGWQQIAIRNAVKVSPWQLAHLAVSRFILEQQLAVAIVADIASIALALVMVVMALRDPRRRGLHDRLARTQVVAAGARANPAS